MRSIMSLCLCRVLSLNSGLRTCGLQFPTCSLVSCFLGPMGTCLSVQKSPGLENSDGSGDEMKVELLAKAPANQLPAMPSCHSLNEGRDRQQ